MKHRSIGAFVLLAATLFAIPQAAQDIRSLKGAIYEHARGQLLQAFLSFNSQEAAPASRRRMSPASCPGAAKGESAVASAAKKASPRSSSAARGVSMEPFELADILVEEAGEALPLPAVAEFVGEAVEAVREVAQVEVSDMPGPGAVGARMATPAARGGWSKVASPTLMPSEWKGRETAALDRLKAQDNILKIEMLNEADLARLLSAQRVRHFKMVRRGKPASSPQALGGELPPPPHRLGADAAEAQSSGGPAWSAEKQ